MQKKTRIFGWSGAILTMIIILLLTGACKKKSEQAKMHFDQGVQYVKQQKIEEAFREFRQAIQLAPDYADAHFHLGGIYHAVKGYTDAINEYNQVLRINPQYPKIHTAMGNLYYERGLKAWGRAIKIAPVAFWVPDTLRQLPFKSRTELVNLIQDYQNKIETDTANAEIFSKLSQAYCILAVEEYQNAVQANPSDTGAQLYLALSYSEQGYTNKAMMQYDILKELDPRSGDLLLTVLKQKEKELEDIERYKKKSQ